MVDLLQWFKQRIPGRSGSARVEGDMTGFVYVSTEEQGPMTSAAPGLRIGRFTDMPPWIVVDHSPHSAIIAKWPGRLWKVQVLHKASEQPYTYARYTRATAVHVLEEMPLSVLFDPNGEVVVEFLNRISRLSRDAAAKLGALRDEEAVHVHNVVWDRWLSKHDPASPFVNQDHTGTIGVGSKVPRSPVGNAASVLHSELTKRARELVGEDAFIVDDEEQCFSPEWARIAACLQHAIFAVGVEESLLTPTERAVLWRTYEKAMQSSALRNDA
jgi:hypothetical protein